MSGLPDINIEETLRRAGIDIDKLPMYINRCWSEPLDLTSLMETSTNQLQESPPLESVGLQPVQQLSIPEVLSLAGSKNFADMHGAQHIPFLGPSFTQPSSKTKLYRTGSRSGHNPTSIKILKRKQEKKKQSEKMKKKRREAVKEVEPKALQDQLERGPIKSEWGQIVMRELEQKYRRSSKEKTHLSQEYPKLPKKWVQLRQQSSWRQRVHQQDQQVDARSSEHFPKYSMRNFEGEASQTNHDSGGNMIFNGEHNFPSYQPEPYQGSGILW